MDNHDPLDQQRLPGDHAFAELGKMVLGNQSVDETLRHVAELVRQTLPMIDEVSVTLMNDETAETVVFTGPLAVHLDERQYKSGFGPCLDAALSGETIIVDMSADHSPYPDFASACRRSGITHTASVGLPIPQQVVGALNLYSSAPDPPDEKSMAWVQGFAVYAGVALTNAALYASTAELADQMRAAMKTRAVIEQAKGILMACKRYSADNAFRDLAHASQKANRKLNQVAADLVAQTTTPVAKSTPPPSANGHRYPRDKERRNSA
jgi:GAF domain-containing protein